MFSNDSLFQRLSAAVSAQVRQIRTATSRLIQFLGNKIAELRGYDRKIHPELALLELGGRQLPKLFIDTLPQGQPHEMLANEEFSRLKQVFAEFRDFSRQHGITPIIFYIPAAVHIYAQYSSEASGRSWLSVRDEQVAASENVESAVTFLAQELDVDVATLTPVFQRLAAEGKLLYRPLDGHWNSEGTDVAARFLAQVIKSRELGRRSES